MLGHAEPKGKGALYAWRARPMLLVERRGRADAGIASFRHRAKVTAGFMHVAWNKALAEERQSRDSVEGEYRCE